MMNIYPRNIESAADVKPFQWADDAFIAKTQNLATRQPIEPTLSRNYRAEDRPATRSTCLRMDGHWRCGG